MPFPFNRLVPRAYRGDAVEDVMCWCFMLLVWVLFFNLLDTFVISIPEPFGPVAH